MSPPPRTDTTSAVFDGHLESWSAWQREPWAVVRYAVVADVLDRYLRPLNGDLRILDVGGGDGMDSLRLVEQGHQLTILDFSDGMLGQARQAADRAGVADRVRLVCGDVDAIEDLHLVDFDVVLCHFVVQYVADPETVVAQVVSAARVGGLISLIAPNPPSEVLAKAVRQADPVAALEMLDAHHVQAVTFGHDVARLGWQRGVDLLASAGAEVVGRYGSRSIIDLIQDDDLKVDPERFEQLLDLEKAVAGRSPYRDIARAWQLVAHRR